MAADVFISYARADREKVERIAQALRELDLTVWYDSILDAGQAYDSRISQELQHARSVLVCWSKRSVQSDWVRSEAEIGRGRSVLVSCLLDKCTPTPPFNLLHNEDLSDWDGSREDGSWSGVLRAIGRLTNRPDLTPTTTRKNRRVSRRAMMAAIGGSALAIAGGGGAYWWWRVDSQRQSSIALFQAAERAFAETHRLMLEQRQIAGYDTQYGVYLIAPENIGPPQHEPIWREVRRLAPIFERLRSQQASGTSLVHAEVRNLADAVTALHDRVADINVPRLDVREAALTFENGRFGADSAERIDAALAPLRGKMLVVAMMHGPAGTDNMLESLIRASAERQGVVLTQETMFDRRAVMDVAPVAPFDPSVNDAALGGGGAPRVVPPPASVVFIASVPPV